MLGFVILAPVTLVTVLFTAIACAIAYGILFGPIIEVPVQRPRKGWSHVTGFVRDVATAPLRILKKKARAFAIEHINVLIRTAASAAPPVTAAINQTEDMTRRVAGTLEDMAEQTFRALWTLNHETIPAKINAALIPLRNQLNRHTDRLDQLEDLNRQVAGTVGDTLRQLPWGVPGGYVTNWETFLGRFVQLWHLGFDVLRPQLDRLATETVPALARDIADLARRLDVQIDARFDALGARISELERWRETVVMPRIVALEEAFDLLARDVLGDIGDLLRPALERIAELERQLETLIPQRIAELQTQLDQLRLDLEEGIRTGLGAFASRIEALEAEVFTAIPQRIAAMQLAIDTIAAEIFENVGEGLSRLTDRIIRIEEWVFGELREMVELALGRIEALEANIRDNILPRMRALEDLLAPAAFAALVLATMRNVAPNLFCRNVTRTSEVLCRADPGLVDDLLALLVPVLVLADLCAFMRLMQQAASGMVGVLGDLMLGAADLVECRGAGSPPNLPLTTTQLPSPTQALAL